LAVGAAVALSARLPARPAARPTDVHAEFIKYASGRDSITAYIAYPERRDAAPAVIVIHEIFGMSDFVKRTTEKLAQQGFVALAPDLLTRRGGTPPTSDSAVALIRTLNADTITQDLNAGAAYLQTLKAVRGDRIGVIGFCWGGSQSFRYATNNPSLKAFVVCYGGAPDTAAMRRIAAPGLGAYAENDARISANVPAAAQAMQAAGKDYRYTVYPGVGHGFFRQTDKPEVADTAWAAVIRFFKSNLERK
jgi:carboxymethylenebutenolidase